MFQGFSFCLDEGHLCWFGFFVTRALFGYKTTDSQVLGTTFTTWQSFRLELVLVLGLPQFLFFPWLFLVQKTMGGWQPFESVRVHHPHEVLHGDSIVGLGVDLVLDQPQGHVFSDSCPSESHLYLWFVCSGEIVPVQGTLFQSFYSSPGLYQSVRPGFGVGSSEGNSAALLSGWLASCCRIGSSPPAALGASPTALSDLGIVMNWEKSDLNPSSRAQYLGMLIDTIRERVYPVDTWIIRF